MSLHFLDSGQHEPRLWSRKRGWLAAAVGASILISWLATPLRVAWDSFDHAFFHATNASLGHIGFWDAIWAISNFRAFDLVGAVTMALIFAWSGSRRGQPGTINLLSHALIGAALGLTAQAIIHKIPDLTRISPTLTYDNSQRLSELAPWIKTKDASKSSFPGDHGLILLTLTFYGWPYLVGHARWLAAISVVLFSLPRLMSGAHWISDIAVGSLSAGLIAVGLFYGIGLDRFTNQRIQPILERIILAICPSRWR
jgi:membrane-associated phospholipid phosphatase